MSEKMSEKSGKDSWKNNFGHKVIIGENSFWTEMKYPAMSELESERLYRLLTYMEQIKGFNEITSARAAKILNIQPKTAARLLSKAEKNNIFESEGKTKNKIYRLKRIS